MGDRLIFFLLGLTERERLLLMLLFVVVLPIGIWAGLVQPLRDGRTAARTELAGALIEQQWLSERLSESRRLTLVRQGIDTPPIGIAGLEQSLIEAGLRKAVSELTRRGDDAIELQFDAVPFVDMGHWLNQVSLEWGYNMSGFRIERVDEAGLAAASFSLIPRP